MESDGDEERRALKEAFGESSDSEEDEYSRFLSNSSSSSIPIPSNNIQTLHTTLKWESVERIPGLWICRNFLSQNHQSSLLSAIQQEGLSDETSHNQAMRFGHLPKWAIELARSVRAAVCFGEVYSVGGRELIAEDHCTEEPCPLPFDLLWREPLFDQLIVNVYKPGEGICAHIDLMRFEDGIAIISMESACVMHFTLSEQEAYTSKTTAGEGSSSMRIPVFLNPGSLILMSGEARYLWKHEINRKAGFQLWEGKEIHQERRVSVTLRKLCQSPSQS